MAESGKLWSMGQVQPIPDFVSKVFLEHTHAHHSYIFQLLRIYMSVYTCVCVYIGVAVGMGLQCQQAVDVGHLRAWEIRRDFEER